MIRLAKQDVLSAEADALLVVLDGLHERMMGAIARQLFQKVGEEAWEDVLSQLDFPMKNGTAQVAELDSDQVKFRHIVFVAGLDHLQMGDHARLLKTALRSGLEAARERSFKLLASALYRGGWRTSSLDGLFALLTAADACPSVDVLLCVLDEETHRKAAEHVK